MQLFTAFLVYSLNLHRSRVKNKALLINQWFDSVSAWHIQLNKDRRQFEMIQRYTLNLTANHILSGTIAQITFEPLINKITAKYIKSSLIANHVWTFLFHKAQLLIFFFSIEIRQIYSHLSVPSEFFFVTKLPVRGVQYGPYKGMWKWDAQRVFELVSGSSYLLSRGLCWANHSWWEHSWVFSSSSPHWDKLLLRMTKY